MEHGYFTAENIRKLAVRHKKEYEKTLSLFDISNRIYLAVTNGENFIELHCSQLSGDLSQELTDRGFYIYFNVYTDNLQIYWEQKKGENSE